MDNLKKLFGKNLKKLRQEKKYTQEKLAEKIDISSRALSSIECGKNFVTAETIEKICTALEITPKTLFDFDFQYKEKSEMKDELLYLISNNDRKLADIYRIIKSYLQ